MPGYLASYRGGEGRGEHTIQHSASYVSLGIVSYVVLLAMLAAGGCALVTSLVNWPGIAV